MKLYHQSTYRTLLLILCSCAGLITASAQGAVEDKGLKMRIACVKVKKGLSVLAYRSSITKQFEEIQLNVNHLSGTVNVKAEANGTVHFYDPSNLPEKDKPVSPVATYSSKSGNSGELIMLLLPSSSKVQTIYSCQAIPIGREFQDGSSCIVNLTNKKIYIVENDKKPAKRITNGNAKVIKPNNGKSEMKLQVYTHHKVSKKITNFYTATWSFSPQVKELCLIYQNPGAKWPKTKIISGY